MSIENAPRQDSDTSRQPSRRWLLGIGAVGIGLAAVATPVLLRSTRDHVRGVLATHFGSAISKGEAAERFAADVAAQIDGPGALSERLKNWSVVKFGDLSPFAYSRRTMEELIVTLFLKRTNGWQVWSGVDAELVYVSLDPHVSYCGNFLSAPFDHQA